MLIYGSCHNLKIMVLGCLLSLFFTGKIQGHTHQTRIQILCRAPREMKASIDSVACSFYGVYVADWNSCRQCLYFVYDHTKTSGRRLKKQINDYLCNQKCDLMRYDEENTDGGRRGKHL